MTDANVKTQKETLSDKLFWIFIIFLLIVLAIFIVLDLNPTLAKLLNITNATSVNLTNATVVIGLAGAIAVGIERLIEGFWSIVSVLLKNQWPLSMTLGEKTKNLNNIIDEVDKHVKELQSNARKFDEFSKKAGSDLTEFQSSISYIKTTNVSDPQVQQFTAKALTAACTLQRYDDKFKTALNGVDTVLNGVSNFADTFKDNPGRRVLSILIGMILGLFFTLLTGIDLFKVILGTAFPWGVALTGITLGLGSSPTHEVIQLLTQLKQNKSS